MLQWHCHRVVAVGRKGIPAKNHTHTCAFYRKWKSLQEILQWVIKMYFSGTLKKGGGGKSHNSRSEGCCFNWVSCWISHSWAPGRHKLIVISGLLDSSGLLDNSVLCSWSCCVSVLCSGCVNVRLRSRVGVEVGAREILIIQRSRNICHSFATWFN